MYSKSEQALVNASKDLVLNWWVSGDKTVMADAAYIVIRTFQEYYPEEFSEVIQGINTNSGRMGEN